MGVRSTRAAVVVALALLTGLGIAFVGRTFSTNCVDACANKLGYQGCVEGKIHLKSFNCSQLLAYVAVWLFATETNRRDQAA
jgi:hypothetical protein